MFVCHPGATDKIRHPKCTGLSSCSPLNDNFDSHQINMGLSLTDARRLHHLTETIIIVDDKKY